ncbi:MAG: hypothetical protein ABS79_04855 [Planctomycetes bacterium SCN 63-9]|nr:MAG: hypothetical protein ABS79_04855 [Planctomycetes bacterium SCN 63-9]
MFLNGFLKSREIRLSPRMEFHGSETIPTLFHMPGSGEQSGESIRSSLTAAKEKHLQITRRNRGVSVARMVSKLKSFLSGWLTYFHHARVRVTCPNWMVGPT